MAGEGQGLRSDKRRRLVLFPSPLQGHISPMLQIASALHARGFSITIIHTFFNSPNPSFYPHFTFEPISDGLSADSASPSDFIPFAAALNQNCEAPFRERLKRITAEQTEERVVAVFDDGLLQFIPVVARELGIPRIMFLINSAASVAVYLAFPLLREKGYFPIQDPKSEAPIVEFPPIRIKDLPDIGSEDPDAWFKIVAEALDNMKSSSALVWNTFDSLENATVTQIGDHLQVPVFPLGPLHRYFTSSPSSLMEEEQSCMDWLDQQAPKSVIYVSFGSLATMEKGELEETAWGLANSRQPFLWVLRPGSVRGQEAVQLPEGFGEEIRDRGFIVSWVPQLRVLAHPALGGFWTHSGWNSTLESICEGVPMLCWPSFGDQRVNARYVSHVWKVGLQLERGLQRDEVERAVRKLMAEKEGEDVRETAMGLKMKAEICVKEGGSSRLSLIRLDDFLSAL